MNKIFSKTIVAYAGLISLLIPVGVLAKPAPAPTAVLLMHAEVTVVRQEPQTGFAVRVLPLQSNAVCGIKTASAPFNYVQDQGAIDFNQSSGCAPLHLATAAAPQPLRVAEAKNSGMTVIVIIAGAVISHPEILPGPLAGKGSIAVIVLAGIIPFALYGRKIQLLKQALQAALAHIPAGAFVLAPLRC